MNSIDSSKYYCLELWDHLTLSIWKVLEFAWHPKVWPFKWKLLSINSCDNVNSFCCTERMYISLQCLWMKSYGVTIQMKATEQYVPAVLFVMLYKVVLTFESVDEILWCYHSNESYWAVLSCDTVCSSNFWVCGQNPKVTILVKLGPDILHIYRLKSHNHLVQHNKQYHRNYGSEASIRMVSL